MSWRPAGVKNATGLPGRDVMRFSIILLILSVLALKSPATGMIAKAVKNRIKKLQEGEKIVGVNTTFREREIEDKKDIMLHREGFKGYLIDYVFHRPAHNKIFPAVAKFYVKNSPTLAQYARAWISLDTEYILYGIHTYMLERILKRYPEHGIEMVLTQNSRAARTAVWEICTSLSKETGMIMEVQRDSGHWAYINPSVNATLPGGKPFCPRFDTVVRLHGSPRFGISALKRSHKGEAIHRYQGSSRAEDR
ncbi:hypothetical protein AAMO2058_000484800 [Amorphochlora amoebiformis]